jgi:hypothetical protein
MSSGYRLMFKFKETTFFTGLLTGAIIFFSLLVITGSLNGCGKSTVKKDLITFNIIPDSRVNDERPVYIVLRKVNRMEFLIDNYDGISEMILANPPNESILLWQMIMPGQKETIQVVRPDKFDIAIYALFISPGENWKMLLESPLKPEYTINIKSNELEEYHKGFFW